MKVAFVGAESSGKTTLAALFIRFLAGRGLPVVAIDAGATQRLGEALDVGRRPPALNAHLAEIKEYLRGTNPRIASADAMVETTPPGRGSWLLLFGGADPVHDLAIGTPCGARLLVTGPCHDETTGAVGLYLNHLVDGPNEYVVADCAEESDKFDLIFVVTEPTATGVSEYSRLASYAAAHGVSIAMVGNGIGNDDDLAFLREGTGTEPLTWFARAPAGQATEPMNLLAAAVDGCEKDWPAFFRRAARSHASYARSDLATRSTGPAARTTVRALLAQIDPGFTIPAPQRSLSR